MKIRFKTLARIQICGVLREVRGTPEDDSRLLARSILKKIKLSSEESAFLETQTSAGVMVNLLQAAKLADLEADLNDLEVQKCINVIKNGKWGPEDDDWFEPLLDQLQVAHKEAKKAKV